MLTWVPRLFFLPFSRYVSPAWVESVAVEPAPEPEPETISTPKPPLSPAVPAADYLDKEPEPAAAAVAATTATSSSANNSSSVRSSSDTAPLSSVPTSATDPVSGGPQSPGIVAAAKAARRVSLSGGGIAAQLNNMIGAGGFIPGMRP